ncbi:MAG: alpha/beta hydrolase [Leucobacter sp.]|nr:alpha/beta hydrolase [Leucobacter sp.]
MKLATVEWGDPQAEPLVLIHGVGGSHSMFEHVVEDRWAARFHVIAFDLRGHGASGYDPPWDFGTYVDDIIETLDALGIQQADWVGHSFGGRLILELIARFPERVRRAVATEPVIRITPELAHHRAEQERVGGSWDSLEAFVASRENTGDIDVERYIADVAKDFEQREDGSISRRTDQCAIVSIFGQFASPAPPPETITVPLMLLYSPAFGMVTREQVEAYRPYVEEIVGVPGLHAVLVSAYDETTAAVERFLER